MIEIRAFRRPLLRRAHINREAGVQLLTDLQLTDVARIKRLFAVEQGIFQRRRRRLRSQVFQRQLAGEGRVDVVIVKIGAHGEILHVQRIFPHQIDVAENARRPPHVLIFNIGGVRPLHHAHAQQVVAGFHRRANIELGGQAAAFAKADVLAVNVDFEIGFDAIEFDDGLFALPAVAEGEQALVGAGRVIGRNIRYVDGEGETFVGVLQLTVALHLPHTRYGNRPPLVLKARGKALRYQQRVGEKAEVPLPAEGQEAAAGFAGEGPRLGQ